jgi:uncharacterized membrane protein (DUF4010 family)
MDASQLFKVFAESMLLGAIIGLQRQQIEHPVAGIRTFPLVAALGTLCGVLAQQYSGSSWIIAAGFLAVAAMVVSSSFMRWQIDRDPGMTSEMALLVTFGLGVMLVRGPATVAIAMGVATAAILLYKPELHGLVRSLQSKDVHAVVQFTLITFVVLPVLPNRVYGPFAVLNPRQIWWVVVLVAGISLASYAALKFLGGRSGALASGLVGGLVSSTATTLMISRRSRVDQSPSLAAAAIMAASGVVFLRVAVIIAVIDFALLARLAAPAAALFVVGLVMAGVFTLGTKGSGIPIREPSNPCEMRVALLFAVLYTVILFALAAARHYLGDRGIYAAAGLSGLTDMDAIAVSLARLTSDGQIAARVAVRGIIAASMANMIFKAALAAALGNRPLLWRLLVGFGVFLIAGGVAFLVV